MFKTYKQQIETWIRSLISGEVSKIDRDLTAERAAVSATIRCCTSQINAAVNATNEAVDRLNELSHFKENTALRAHIKDLEAQFVGVMDTFKKLHPELMEK